MTRSLPSIVARLVSKAAVTRPTRRNAGQLGSKAVVSKAVVTRLMHLGSIAWIWATTVATTACASTTQPARYSDSRGVDAPDTLGEPDEGMPDPALRKGGGTAPEGFGLRNRSRAELESVRPGWLGVELQANRDGLTGVRIVELVRRSPAATAGLRPGDVIVQVDGQVMSDPVTLVQRIRATQPGTKLSLGVARQGTLQLVGIQVEPMPNPDELVVRRFVGQKAPPLDGLAVVQGDTNADWNALEGRLVVLEFWAPWCGVCRLMHQRLNEWQTQWSMHGVQVIGIAALSPEQARGFATRFGMGYAIAVDTQEAVFRSYDVFAVPSLFLVDRRGTIVDATTGYSSQRLASMEKKLVALVAEGNAP